MRKFHDIKVFEVLKYLKQ